MLHHLYLKRKQIEQKIRYPKETSLQSNIPINSNQVLKVIKKGIEEGLKPLNKELSDIKEVMQYITINKKKYTACQCS